ncbi:MAG: efflux RND transporter periplasmic adaptor subunit [Anaeromicrobium sp.]|jgi:RND family efflux transporter MFP subunit|uniref:efflux RND transporter periplasmic adaptor subunit n=1 Tax=Anaeromicrobium sp. TaxID=1929132 RepID=UPI0025ECE4CF|nr:efflux RND transporter periplasmic adaptor subunit [Anaeromicrobium sp.]MCT4594446.1 efflux RND transporter periplasmic adaptor subunit [Anaeromicrobium sp.]
MKKGDEYDMKKLVSLMAILILLFSLSGCSKAEADEKKERVKAVKVQEVAKDEKPVSLDYIGTVNSKETTKYGFKVNGKIGSINVEKGDKISKGQVLGTLDTSDLKFQVTAAKGVLDAAELNIKRASDALNYDREYFNKIEKLYGEKAVSRDTYDKVKLKLDQSEAAYLQGKAKYEQAKADYDYKTTLIEDAALTSKDDGVVLDILAEESELVAAYHPIVVLRSNEQVINVGVAQRDIDKLKLGQEAQVDVDGNKANGNVTNISEVPDKESRTYNVEVTVNTNHYRLGSIANVDFPIGAESGIWVPVTSIFSNGEDYVYIIEGDRAFKRTIQIDKISDNKMLVKGLKAGEKIAISGMKNLDDGTKVKIVE